jgi:uncharacterized protein YlxW (UPF0749 family)
MSPSILPAIVGVLASAIIATSMAAIVQTRAADEARAERDALQTEVDELRDEIRQLEAELEDQGRTTRSSRWMTSRANDGPRSAAATTVERPAILATSATS